MGTPNAQTCETVVEQRNNNNNSNNNGANAGGGDHTPKSVDKIVKIITKVLDDNNNNVQKANVILPPPPPPQTTPIVKDNNNNSAVEAFYMDSVILVTGATGFLGKALLEKLLRSCSGIGTIFVLMRPKRGRSIEQRFNELVENPVYQFLLL